MNRAHSPRFSNLIGSVLLLWLAAPPVVFAPPPAWWAQRGATNTNPPDQLAVANLGQLKQMAAKGCAEMNAWLPGGAGQAINDLVTGWHQPGSNRDDLAAMSLGQLKYVGKLFYDRLIQVRYTNQYPWTGSTIPADDGALGNLGQLKQVFNFDLSLSSANDGVPDWWKRVNFGSASVPGSGALDYWNNSTHNNLYYFQHGINPGSGNLAAAHELLGGPVVDLVVFTRLE